MSTAPEVRLQRIEPAQAGQRIDNYLLGQLKGVPRTHVYRILRKGEVRVNKGRVKPTYRLQAGDVVRVPPVRTAASGGEAPPRQAGERLLARVLHEDAQLLALDKPAGVPVHAGTGRGWGVIEALRAVHTAPLELAHRLDQPTSGVLICAKDKASLATLQAGLRAGAWHKRYLLLVRGHWPSALQRVDAPLDTTIRRGGERTTTVSPAGRAAATQFRVRARFATATLLEAVLETGRTHQIRVHAAHAGHPLAGDARYGDAAFDADLKRYGLRRLFLHAEALHLPHPVGGGALALEAPLPADLADLLAHLAPEAA